MSHLCQISIFYLFFSVQYLIIINSINFHSLNPSALSSHMQNHKRGTVGNHQRTPTYSQLLAQSAVVAAAAAASAERKKFAVDNITTSTARNTSNPLAHLNSKLNSNNKEHETSSSPSRIVKRSPLDGIYANNLKKTKTSPTSSRPESNHANNVKDSKRTNVNSSSGPLPFPFAGRQIFPFESMMTATMQTPNTASAHLAQQQHLAHLLPPTPAAAATNSHQRFLWQSMGLANIFANSGAPSPLSPYSYPLPSHVTNYASPPGFPSSFPYGNSGSVFNLNNANTISDSKPLAKEGSIFSPTSPSNSHGLPSSFNFLSPTSASLSPPTSTAADNSPSLNVSPVLAQLFNNIQASLGPSNNEFLNYLNIMKLWQKQSEMNSSSFSFAGMPSASGVSQPCEPNQYKCNECDEQLPTIESWREHKMRQHQMSVVRSFECQACGSLFEKQHLLVEHMSKQHSLIVHRCDLCIGHKSSVPTFATAAELADHQRSEHSAERQLHKCRECEQTFRKENELLEHCRKEHPLPSMPSEKCGLPNKSVSPDSTSSHGSSHDSNACQSSHDNSLDKSFRNSPDASKIPMFSSPNNNTSQTSISPPKSNSKRLSNFDIDNLISSGEGKTENNVDLLDIDDSYQESDEELNVEDEDVEQSKTNDKKKEKAHISPKKETNDVQPDKCSKTEQTRSIPHRPVEDQSAFDYFNWMTNNNINRNRHPNNRPDSPSNSSMASISKSSVVMSCFLCPETFDHVAVYADHMTNHVKELSTPGASRMNGPIECPACGERLIDPAMLFIHSQLHYGHLANTGTTANLMADLLTPGSSVDDEIGLKAETTTDEETIEDSTVDDRLSTNNFDIQLNQSFSDDETEEATIEEEEDSRTGDEEDAEVDIAKNDNSFSPDSSSSATLPLSPPLSDQ